MHPHRLPLPAFRLPALLLATLFALLTGAGAARADTVYLTDGSQIVGTIQKLANKKLRIQTEFTGELTVDAANVKGLTADRKLTVALDSGDRLVGTPTFDTEAGTQKVTGTSFGEVALEEAAIVGVWGPDEPAPTVQTKEEQLQQMAQEKEKAVSEAKKANDAELAELKKQHQKQIAELQKEMEPFGNPWSLRLEAGLRGRTGNQERISFDARAEARREVPDERLLIFSEGHYAEQSGTRSQNEIRGGGKLEVDISEKFFVFGKGELEFDEFENLDMRTTLSSGLGYFFWEKPDHEFKGRIGLGYQHESFMDGTTFDQGLLELGYNYRYDFNPWLRFTHDLTYYPTFDDPMSDYRIEAETAGEVPLSGDKAWKLRVGMRNEYDAQPQPGVERLDTLYFLNLVYDIK